MNSCIYCGLIHIPTNAICPRIKSVEYHNDGTIKKVELHDSGYEQKQSKFWKTKEEGGQ